MSIFNTKSFYSFKEIIYICEKNDLVTVDCLKDENMISVEQEGGGDCIFEFLRIQDELFIMTWEETNSDLMPTQKT